MTVKINNVRIGGCVSDVTRIKSRKGAPGLVIVLEHDKFDISILVFGNDVKSLFERLEEGDEIIVDGKLSERDGNFSIFANKVITL